MPSRSGALGREHLEETGVRGQPRVVVPPEIDDGVILSERDLHAPRRSRRHARSRDRGEPRERASGRAERARAPATRQRRSNCVETGDRSEPRVVSRREIDDGDPHCLRSTLEAIGAENAP